MPSSFTPIQRTANACFATLLFGLATHAHAVPNCFPDHGPPDGKPSTL